MNRLTSSIMGIPNTRPAPISPSTFRTTSQSTALRCAPTAMRIPISRVLRMTAKDMMPYSPIPARRSARPPNRLARMDTSLSSNRDSSTCCCTVATLVMKPPGTTSCIRWRSTPSIPAALPLVRTDTITPLSGSIACSIGTYTMGSAALRRVSYLTSRTTPTTS